MKKIGRPKIDESKKRNSSVRVYLSEQEELKLKLLGDLYDNDGDHKTRSEIMREALELFWDKRMEEERMKSDIFI